MKNLIVIFILSFLFIGCIPTQYPEVSILTETETRLLVKVETDSTEIVNESIINSNLVDFTIWDSVDFKDFTSPSVFYNGDTPEDFEPHYIVVYSKR